MKLTQVFYFVALLITIKVFVPGLNNNGLVQAKSAGSDSKSLKKLDKDMLKKKRNQQIMIISTIASSLALLIGTALGGYNYYQQKNSKKSNGPVITNVSQTRTETRNLSRSQEDLSKVPAAPTLTSNASSTSNTSNTSSTSSTIHRTYTIDAIHTNYSASTNNTNITINAIQPTQPILLRTISQII
ncbi:hypothetical protein AK88_04814 [Plasmodium fragile]|uniref:Early transcribed membrane protein n=1 Tax=Plasmodium fragile TaxID=5857 RepID=A0A0D9QEW3_PLAFR|nr:uncharacterized protein AK88_04814 [Plasmodium fragile]KJP85548.1 hypothetical protein AK88_04814 [Plasmodium fragile]